MEYEQYHQKGGTYILPVEVFNELLDEKEKLEQENKQLKNNWNNLKKWLAEHILMSEKPTTKILLKSILANVKEIERNDENE